MAAEQQTVVPVPEPSPPPPKFMMPQEKHPRNDRSIVYGNGGGGRGGRGGGDYSSSSSSSRRSLCACIAVFLLLAGVTALVVWLVYRPQKPRFTVVGAAVYELNTTAPPLVSATMQFTIVTRNPNRRVSLYYDRLSVYVSYKNQAITAPVQLPPLYHERKSTLALSPVLEGGAVPVSVEVANGLAVDEAYGVVGLRVVVTGRLRWKAGAIKTVHYGLYVRCDVLVGLKKGVVGQVPLLTNTQCKVDV